VGNPELQTDIDLEMTLELLEAYIRGFRPLPALRQPRQGSYPPE
jgi:hypothetical protein